MKMNGPLSMYKLKPLVSFSDALDLPSTMYKMKNIYSVGVNSADVNEARVLPNVLEQVNKLLKEPASEIEDLKIRQEAILQQLTYLKEQMLALREELGKKSSSPTSSNETSKKVEMCTSHQGVVLNPFWSGVIQEVVVHANPDCPPYSLLIVNQLWPQVLRLYATCHTHSSIVTLPSHLAVFAPLSCTPDPTLNVRIVWKQMGPDCELIISPLTHCPIRGEVNLLRYLYRTICSANDVVIETKLDSMLDLCHRLSHARTLRDKQQLVRALNAQLGKAEWLGGEAMSVVDVAAWSAVRAVSGIELSQNMTRWQTRCCAAAGVEAA